MIRRTKVVLISIIVILIIFSILSFIFPYVKQPQKGDLKVNWSAPRGLLLNDMRDGDSIDLEFSSDEELDIYLITRQQGNEFRSPSFYKDPLPDPIYTGAEGELHIEIDSDADYELLLWNQSLTSSIDIEYSILKDSQKERNISFISGSCLVLLAMIPTAILLIARRRERENKWI